MTYQRDGSPFQIPRHKALANVLYYGWLTSKIPFEKQKDKQDYVIFQKLADSIKHRMTRGHHQCEFCGWRDANYGNGEMWIGIENMVYVFPRMIWHYMKDHDYGLPEEIYNSIKSGHYEALTRQKIEQLFLGQSGELIDIPYLVCRALWKEDRYKDMGEFFNQNSLRWFFGQAAHESGYFVVEMNQLPAHINILFEDDPQNFPNQIIIAMESS